MMRVVRSYWAASVARPRAGSGGLRWAGAWTGLILEFGVLVSGIPARAEDWARFRALGGVLFMLREGGILTSFDAKTGRVIKQGRVEGALGDYFASPVAAPGRLYLLNKEGNLAVVKAAGEWEVLKVSSLDEECWGTPAIAGTDLIVKTQKSVWCFRKPR